LKHILNLGILAHVDAGKTSLTERLLYAAGVIDEIGSVDDGSTQTDSLALERQRGITIKSAVVSFVVDDVTINLIDTPGHPDFIAEVERALSVLDGVVLVVSAVEGVQAQTRVLMRTLQRLCLPTLFFVNKIDRGGAQPERVTREIAAKLTPAIIPMASVSDPGTRGADVTLYSAADTGCATRLADLLADHDDDLLSAYVADETAVSYDWLLRELAAQTSRAQVHPIYYGSAMTGAGVAALIAGITDLLPATEGDVHGPVSGSVFKVERGVAGEKIAYVRMFSGTVRTRDRLRVRHDYEPKVTAIRVFDRGGAVQQPTLGAGQIGKLWGLGDVQIGDVLGAARSFSEQHYFAPPTLETVVVPRRAGEKGALHTALTQLAEQDPLINVRQDDVQHEIFVSLYGEVQKEVIQATLANEFNIDVEFRETTTICIERPVGVGADVEVLGKAGNPFQATVGLRIEPAPVNTGITFCLEAEPVTIPIYVYKSVEEFRQSMAETVRETLQQGQCGWQVTDCLVTMTHSGYVSPNSTSGDFRKLTPLVLMSALKQAGTVVCEPIHRFRLEIPTDTFSATMPVLARLRAVPRTQEPRASSYVLEGTIPAARVHELQRALPALTRGEGVIECAFDRYQPVNGAAPVRPRTDLNPLNRKEYLLHLLRRV
jgi:ribosomal protection tetracycline resistance protein